MLIEQLSKESSNGHKKTADLPGLVRRKSCRVWLPQYAGCLEFVNADLIAGGLSPFNQSSADLVAGKLMLDRIHFLAQRRADFAFETTLSGKAYVSLLEKLKSSGYHISSLFFLWLPDIKLSLQRIADRVRQGGHNVPPDVVRRRFKRGIANLISCISSLVRYVDVV